MEKIKLELVGITYSQIESGVYAVILQQEGAARRIPIIIGFPEAQSIECKLQDVVTPRPLTHDLMISIMSSFGITLKEVLIYKLPDGVFAAQLILMDGDNLRCVDSRSSDAIALAIRVGAPIYTTPEVLDEAGFEPGERNVKAESDKKDSKLSAAVNTQENSLKSLDELMSDMQAAAEAENYEEAARIKAEIDRRSK